jgi:hypothetical protein
MSEILIEMTVCGRAEKAGWLVRKCQWVGRRGAPDRLFCKAGRLLFIEFKAPGKVAEPHQEREIARLHGQGVEAYVVDNIADGLVILGLEA